MAHHTIRSFMPLGGKVEENDRWRFEVALFRELQEEGGIDAYELNPLDEFGNRCLWAHPIYSHKYDLRGRTALDILYLFEMKKRDIRGEKTGIWIPLETWSEHFGLPLHRKFLRKIQQWE